jgi:hypothetical protein
MSLFRNSFEIFCTSFTKKNRLELFGEMSTVYFLHNEKPVIEFRRQKAEVLMLNESVHTARTPPEGIKIGVSEITVEFRYVCNVMFIIY